MSTSASSKPAPKRSGGNGTASSPYAIDSDSDDEPTKKRTYDSKRMKYAKSPQLLLENDNAESSDDEPLINRLAARSSPRNGLAESKARTFSEKLEGVLYDREPSAASSAIPVAPVELHRNCRKFVGGYNSPAKELLSPYPSKRSIYGEQTNLTSVFRNTTAVSRPGLPHATDSSPATRQPPRASPPLSNLIPSPCRRLPTPDRLFTRMRLIDFNKLVEVVDSYAEKGARGKSNMKRKGKTRSGLVKSGPASRILSEKEEDDEVETEFQIAGNGGAHVIDLKVDLEEPVDAGTIEGFRRDFIDSSREENHAGCNSSLAMDLEEVPALLASATKLICIDDKVSNITSH